MSLRNQDSRPFEDLLGPSILERLFRATIGGSMDADSSVDWFPTVDIEETEEGFSIKADLPDLRREDVFLTVKDRVLTLAGERTRSQDQEERTFHRLERAFGRFSRAFNLPPNVDETHVEANLRDGVLTITLPKRKTIEGDTVRIPVD